MDVNGWLTIVSVFLAILTFLPNEERTIILGRQKGTIIILGILNILVIPCLIYFNQISEYWTFLENFTIHNGFAPKDIAFFVFFITIFVIIYLIFNTKSKQSLDEIKLFEDWLIEKPFVEFFKLFTKYVSTKDILKNWGDYKSLLFHPIFLKYILDIKPLIF